MAQKGPYPDLKELANAPGFGVAARVLQQSGHWNDDISEDGQLLPEWEMEVEILGPSPAADGAACAPQHFVLPAGSGNVAAMPAGAGEFGTRDTIRHGERIGNTRRFVNWLSGSSGRCLFGAAFVPQHIEVAVVHSL